MALAGSLKEVLSDAGLVFTYLFMLVTVANL